MTPFAIYVNAERIGGPLVAAFRVGNGDSDWIPIESPAEWFPLLAAAAIEQTGAVAALSGMECEAWAEQATRMVSEHIAYVRVHWDHHNLGDDGEPR